MTKFDAFVTPEGLATLNAICDEYRRQLKGLLVKSKGESPCQISDVIAAAQHLQKSTWLKQFDGSDSNVADKRAA